MRCLVNAIASSLWTNYFHVGQSAFRYGDHVLAECMFREALAQASRTASSAMQQADSAHALALTLLTAAASERAARRAEALQLLRRAVRIYATLSNLDCHNFVAAVSILADSYCEEQFPERALPLLKEAIKVVVARSGLAAPDLIPLFPRMALIYSEKKYFARADKFLHLSLITSSCATKECSRKNN